MGGIISPKLFNMFLADMNEYLDHKCGITINGTTFTHLLYADDLVLMSENPNDMQILLNNLEAYCRKWHLLINSQKSKVMVMNAKRGSSVSDNEFVIGDDKLEVVDSYKYLGHVLCNSGNIHKLMYDHLASQAQKAMHALKEKIKATVGYLPPNLSLKMFDTHILPILEYNSEIWVQTKEIDILEKLQLKFLKNLLGVRSQTSTIAILADTGRFSLIYRQQASALKYWHRLKSDSVPKLLQTCLEIQVELQEKSYPCWLTKIYSISNSLDCSGATYTHMYESLFKKAQTKLMLEINNSDLNPKLRTYKQFKKDLRLEPYLNCNLPKSIYQNIARFRLSSHNLHIELGRHERPFIPAEDRICKRCDSNCVEDEFHCLMICNNWTDIRVELLEVANEVTEHFTVLSPKEQFLKMLSHKNESIQYALGKFLNTVLKTDNVV